MKPKITKTGANPVSRHSLMHRRQALKAAAASLASGLTLPHVWARHGHVAPSKSIAHASFGGGGMAWSDIDSLARTSGFQLVAVADVDKSRFEAVQKRFPGVRLYQDWRELLDKEKNLDSANVSTPDHMHAPIAMRAMRQGVNIYGQKPLTQSIYEARQLTQVAASKKLVTQMGIQIHSHPVHRKVVAILHAGAIGKVKAVHSWSGKEWGDNDPLPDRKDPIPATLDWDGWLGVAKERPFLANYYHPGNWRKRLDFGTGTFGDMGCHILDPVYESLGVDIPNLVVCEKGGTNQTSWGLHNQVRFEFPGSAYTTETVSLTWYDGNLRPGKEVSSLLEGANLSDQGSIYIGTSGVLYSPYIDEPVLLPKEKFSNYKKPEVQGADHYGQFLEAVRGNGKTTAPFSYAGPLTEMVLLGCLSTRFPGKALKWNKEEMKVTNLPEANRFVRKEYRKGFEVEGL